MDNKCILKESRMWPFGIRPKKSRSRNGNRTVHGFLIRRNAHYGINGYPFYDEMLIFIISGMRYCVSPVYYRRLLPYPGTETIDYYSKRFKTSVNEKLLNEYIDIFNREAPSELMKKIVLQRVDSVFGQEEAFLAGALYLKTLRDMRRCGHNAHAYRINALTTLFYDNLDSRGIEDRNVSETFWIFTMYLKDVYCQERTYEKRK